MPAFENTLTLTHTKNSIIHKLPQSSFVNTTPLRGVADDFTLSVSPANWGITGVSVAPITCVTTCKFVKALLFLCACVCMKTTRKKSSFPPAICFSSFTLLENSGGALTFLILDLKRRGKLIPNIVYENNKVEEKMFFSFFFFFLNVFFTFFFTINKLWQY